MNLIILREKDFVSKNRVELRDRRLDHILDIYDVSKGDTLKVGKLNGKLGLGNIINLNSDIIEMEVNFTKEPPTPLNIDIILAMPRPKMFKRILQDLTSMGIKNLYLIKTWKVEKSFWRSPALERKVMEETMILGLEQGKDTILPKIEIFKGFKPFIEDIVPEITKGRTCFLAHPSEETSEVSGNNERKITIAIGPEGGFIPYEVGMFKTYGFKQISLGRRILRVETAIPYILGRIY